MRCAARRARVPAGLLVLALAAAPAGDNPAEGIAAAVGHPARLHLRAEATRLRDGQSQTLTLDVAGMLRAERICAADVCRGSWFDGKQTFTFGINGTPLPERGADDAAARTYAAIASTAFAEPQFLATGGEVRPFRGRPGERYTVKAPDGSELVAVADARTGRLHAVERPDGAVFTTLTTTGATPPLLYAPLVYDRVTSVAEPLKAPSGPRVDFAGTAGDVPLLIDPLPVVPCRLGGFGVRCLIDSGSTPSAMTLDLAERLNREPHGAIEIAGLGSYLTGVIDALPLEIGAATLPELNFAILPRARADFDVIVGSDVLARLRIDLEPARHRARIVPSGPASGAPVITIEFAGGLPLTDVRLGDRIMADSMLVDTGDVGTLSIGYDAYRQDPGLFTVRQTSRASGAAAATLDALGGQLDFADVGKLRFERVAIVAVRGQHQGHLGYGFAARCGRFTLDLGHRQVECNIPAPPRATAAPRQR